VKLKIFYKNRPQKNCYDFAKNLCIFALKRLEKINR
jgi:hypothetical protein